MNSERKSILADLAEEHGFFEEAEELRKDAIYIIVPNTNVYRGMIEPFFVKTYWSEKQLNDLIKYLSDSNECFVWSSFISNPKIIGTIYLSSLEEEYIKELHHIVAFPTLIQFLLYQNFLSLEEKIEYLENLYSQKENNDIVIEENLKTIEETIYTLKNVKYQEELKHKLDLQQLKLNLTEKEK